VYYYVNKHIKLNIMAYRSANNSTNRPVSNWCGTKDPVESLKLINLKEVYNNIRSVAMPEKCHNTHKFVLNNERK
jgi:hypothetical protein